MSHAMKPISVLADYCGDGNPLITWTFAAGRGWKRTAYNKRASVSWLRKLKREGVTHVAVALTVGGGLGERVADFSIDELLKGTA